MALEQSVGTALAVSAGWPATDNQTGYEALTFTAAGQVTNLPTFRGTKDVVTFDDLTTGNETKLVGMLRGGSGTLSFAFDDADAGQDILDTASQATTTSGSQVSIRMTLTGGTVFYRKAVVTSYNISVGINQFSMAEVGLEFSAGGDVKVAA